MFGGYRKGRGGIPTLITGFLLLNSLLLTTVVQASSSPENLPDPASIPNTFNQTKDEMILQMIGEINNNPVFDLLFVEDSQDYLSLFSTQELLADYSVEQSDIQNEGKPQDELERELIGLHNLLQSGYHKLLNLASVIVNWTPDDYVRIAENLNDEDDFEAVWDKIKEEKSTFVLGDEQITIKDGTVYSKSLSVESQDNGEEHGEDDELLQFDSESSTDLVPTYFDRDTDYEMLYQALVEGEDDDEVSSQAIMSIIMKIKKKVKKKKRKLKIIFKLWMLKKKLKKKKAMLCLKIIYLIEKIKRTTRMLISKIKNELSYLIKVMPWRTIWKLKVLIRKILTKIGDILWDLKIVLLQIKLKLMYLIKKFGVEVPVEIITYLKGALVELLGIEEEERERREEQAWELFERHQATKSDNFDWNKGDQEDYDQHMSAQSIIDYEVSSSNEFKIPKEIRSVFHGKFTSAELNELYEYEFPFNFDGEFEGKQIDDVKLEDIYETSLIVPKLFKRGLFSFGGELFSNGIFGGDFFDNSFSQQTKQEDAYPKSFKDSHGKSLKFDAGVQERESSSSRRKTNLNGTTDQASLELNGKYNSSSGTLSSAIRKPKPSRDSDRSTKGQTSRLVDEEDLWSSFGVKGYDMSRIPTMIWGFGVFSVVFIVRAFFE
ncbi:hypothetical protein WICPIJ_001553 [Wickerhamomyces pijperi]|uniref:Uncharacterized protein n=1 Tax=Wickerhamomyces pijperi TaxID=599730 RepID=A0A9P8QAP3_WICPI|nr:hypothetical protein WICPIJ_001553 [Wickerhamomyces pijperi]